MPRINAANNARTTLVQAVGTSDTTIYVQSVASFPSPPFRITIDNEIMEVTAVNATYNSFTVERAKEGTTATTHSIGASVENRWTAGTYAELVSADHTHTNLDAHLAETAIHKTSDVIRTETNTQLKVEVISSSVSETPDAGRIIFDTSQGKFFGGNGTEWV